MATPATLNQSLDVGLRKTAAKDLRADGILSQLKKLKSERLSRLIEESTSTSPSRSQSREQIILTQIERR